jgi:endonuclease-3 related protein
MLRRRSLLALYRRLMEAYGPQGWWPAETPFEVMAGAVLTQNTAWRNVEQALAALKARDLLDPARLCALPHAELAALVRPAGYFNIKARRLVNLCRWLEEGGGIRRLRRRSTASLRASLLAINGIGPETADDILLYAFNRPVFVIDAYTRRVLRRLGWIEGGEPYETLRLAFENALDPDAALFNEYHALIVRHAKAKCLTAPGCRHCRVEKPFLPRRPGHRPAGEAVRD